MGQPGRQNTNPPTSSWDNLFLIREEGISSLGKLVPKLTTCNVSVEIRLNLVIELANQGSLPTRRTKSGN